MAGALPCLEMVKQATSVTRQIEYWLAGSVMRTSLTTDASNHCMQWTDPVITKL